MNIWCGWWLVPDLTDLYLRGNNLLEHAISPSAIRHTRERDMCVGRIDLCIYCAHINDRGAAGSSNEKCFIYDCAYFIIERPPPPRVFAMRSTRNRIFRACERSKWQVCVWVCVVALDMKNIYIGSVRYCRPGEMMMRQGVLFGRAPHVVHRPIYVYEALWTKVVHRLHTHTHACMHRMWRWTFVVRRAREL